MVSENDVRVKMFSPGLLVQVQKLILKIETQEFGLPLTLEDHPDIVDISASYQTGAGNFWVALHGDTIVGTIALFDLGDGRAQLRKVYVLPEYRGSTYRTAVRMLQTLLNRARHQGFRDIYLQTTGVMVAAQRFYEKHGFSPIPKEALPENFPVIKVATKFYHLALP